MMRIVLAIAVGLVAAASGASAASESTPRWQPVPVTKADDHAVAWASGRVWIFNNGAADTGRFVTKSARIVNGGVASWATATLGGTRGWINLGLHGQDLIFRTSQAGALQAVRLLPNGRLGKPTEVSGAPTPSSSGGSLVIRLPDRAVRIAGAGQAASPHVGVCCDVQGEAADYSSFIPPSSLPVPLLGLDRHGRLWLAWAPGRQGKKPAQIVELDPSTLEPRGNPASVPGSLVLTRIIDLACANDCRLVMSAFSRSRTGTNFSWAPGEQSPTTISPPGQNPGVIGARTAGGHLIVAYSADGGSTVRLARGNERGTALRLVSSISLPGIVGTAERGAFLTVGPVGAFGPNGFAAVAVYETGSHSPGGYKAYVRVAILPLRP